MHIPQFYRSGLYPPIVGKYNHTYNLRCFGWIMTCCKLRIFVLFVRGAQMKLAQKAFGHCPISFCKPLFGCPRPKSLKMTKIAPFPQPNFVKWLWFLKFFRNIDHSGHPGNCEKYDILLQVVCGNGAILVIFSDFGLGQPKRHFFDTFFQFWPWRGPKCDKNHL